MDEVVSCPPTSRLTHSTGVRHLSRLHFPVSLTARCGLVANFWPLVTDNDAYNFQTTSLKGKVVHLPVPKTQEQACSCAPQEQYNNKEKGIWVSEWPQGTELPTLDHPQKHTFLESLMADENSTIREGDAGVRTVDVNRDFLCPGWRESAQLC